MTAYRPRPPLLPAERSIPEVGVPESIDFTELNRRMRADCLAREAARTKQFQKMYSEHTAMRKMLVDAADILMRVDRGDDVRSEPSVWLDGFLRLFKAAT